MIGHDRAASPQDASVRDGPVTAQAPATLRLRDRELALVPGRPVLMGVLNTSPESFFDGPRGRDPRGLVARGRELMAQGAAIVDVGGESGVTDRPPVEAAEEARRVVPVVEPLAAEGGVVSVDTWKADVADAALAAGAALVNDPSGLSDPELAAVCAEHRAGLVLTHTRALPKRKDFPRYDDVVADVVEFLSGRLEAARAAGVDRQAIVLDPGPDLAKTPAETVAVLRALDRVRALGRPLLLAVSRKDFVGAIPGRAPGERLAGTLAAVGEGVDAGAALVRVHDVAAVADFLAVRAALRGEREVAGELRLDPGLRREPESGPEVAAEAAKADGRTT